MRRLGQGIAVALIVMLLAYPLSYIALLDPVVAEGGGNLRWTVHFRRVSFRGFGDSEEFLNAVYKPLILLDQKLRPDYWSWTEHHDLSRKATP